jgi:CDP-diacylglycerol---glycerol-3-phosphate 3-phosphatidyltransferase
MTAAQTPAVPSDTLRRYGETAMAKIFSVSARAVLGHVVNPVARRLLRVGVSPNAVTLAGTAGVLVGALGFATRGHLITALVIVTLAALTDMLDGAMARMRGGSTRFGALLDSTMDRVSDGAVLGAVAFWLADQGNPYGGAAAALICLVAGQVVSYVKARAEGLGLSADVGVAERPERLIIVGIGGLISGLGIDWGLPAALWALSVLSVLTVWQRVWHVHQADRAAVAGTPEEGTA